MFKLKSLLPWSSKSDSSLEIFRQMVGGDLSKSGASVTWKTALEVSTVLACARVIAEGIAQVPLKLFRESPDGKSRLPAKDHPLYNVLHRRPNAWQTSFEYRETIGLHCVLAGRHYSFINRVMGEIVELIPLEPQNVRVKCADNGTLTYEVTGRNSSIKVFPAEAIWHVRGPSWNGWEGLEAVKHAREAIGLAIATESHHARLHRNGVRPGGLYSVEGSLTKEQYADLRKWLENEVEGPNNAFKTMILDRNAKWISTAMSGVDAQHLETRRYQVEEICRFARVMPIMVGYSDKAQTYASAEQMFLAHVVHTLSPWYERLEQSIDVNLLTDKDAANGIYAKFVTAGLLRGALKDTAEYLYRLVSIGIMDRNEAREKLEMNPRDGLDVPLTPANMNVGTDLDKDSGKQGE